MARYNYRCEKCIISDYITNCTIPEMEIFVSPNAEDPTKESFIWEVSHSIAEEPKILCPICNKQCSRTMSGVQVTGYVKGNGFLDKAGVRREMDLHTLKNNDPYAHMRPSGDKEELEKKINKKGRDSMRFKSRMDESLIRGIDETNIIAVQRTKREWLENKPTN